MYSESFEKAYKKILKAEGGYVESSSEGGGAANAGITLTRYRTFLGNNNATKEDLRKISEAHKKEIYKQEWDVVGGDQIQDKRIANILFDQSVNKGPRVIKDMQRTLGMTPTGNITDVVSTLNAKSFEENTEVGNKFVDRQFKDYASIAQRNPEKAKFLNGWNKRLSKVANENGITGASPEATEETFINEKRASSPYSPDENPFLLQKKTEEEDREALQNISVIDNGQFRFNDILLDIPPEQISVIMDEYESSLLLMRQDIPVTAQSGKKRVRIIVNFPYDFAMGWNKLAKMIIQIRKTPIATIENEK
jgi:lysozyme family protein